MNPPPLPSPSDEEKSPASSCSTVSSPTSTSTSTNTGDQQQHRTVAANKVDDDGQLNDMAKKPKKKLEIIHNDPSSQPMPTIPLLAARLHDTTTASSSSSPYFASYLIKEDVKSSSPLPRLEVINDFDNNAPIPSVLENIDMVVGATSMMKQKSMDRSICGVVRDCENGGEDLRDIENKHNIMTVSSSKVNQNLHSEQPPTSYSTQTSFTAPPPPLEEIVIERRTPVNNDRCDCGSTSPLNANDDSIPMGQLIASKVAYGHGVDPSIITAPTAEQSLSIADEGGAPPTRRSLESSQTEEHQMVDDLPFTVLEATLVVEDVVYDAIPFDFKAKQHNDDDDDEIPPHPGWCQRRIRCASIVLVLIAVIATTSSLVMLKRNKSYQSTSIEASSVLGDELLGDGEACKSSWECNNGCCSSYNSNDGFYKCTVVDGGLLADGICVDGGEGKREDQPANNVTNEYGIRGDWEACIDSLQCSNGCCSNNYSDDGFYKCTILTGGYRSDICVGRGGNNNEEGGGARGDWEACFYSKQCINGCCSNSYSDDGFYKCTILDGGYRSDICV